MSSFRFTHPRLGTIVVTGRPNSGKLSARWINGELHVNVPAAAPRSHVIRTIESHVADFESMRPAPRFRIGQTIDCHNFSIAISAGTLPMTKPDIRLAADSTPDFPRFVISIPPTQSIESPQTTGAITGCLHLAARRLAPAILLPRARSLAARFGLRVDTWEIAHGKTTLGSCYPSQRRIRLSYMCVFLDTELRDYIICHELAHLTEPGHTPAFHRLCDRYCEGHEARLIRRLHTYPWPVDR